MYVSLTAKKIVVRACSVRFTVISKYYIKAIKLQFGILYSLLCIGYMLFLFPKYKYTGQEPGICSVEKQCI